MGRKANQCFFILCSRLLVLRILCIMLHWKTGNLTTFVTLKGSEYTLQHCDGSKPQLMSFLFFVNVIRFVLLIAVYIFS